MPKSKQVVSKPHRTWGPNTLNNPTREEIAFLENIQKDVSRIVVGMEYSKPKDGGSATPHLQFTITYKKPRRLSALKKELPRAHWEPTVDPSAAYMYCMKEGEVLINVDNRAQGARTDLQLASKMGSVREVAEQYPETFIKYHSGISKYFSLMIPAPRRPNLRVLWFWGPTGSGKTWSAWEEGGDKMVAVSLSGDRSNPFVNGYSDQTEILFDDLRSDQVSLARLLTLLDIYPVMVNIKGGSVPLLATLIIITAPSPPELVFSGSDEDLGQITRRITEVREFSSRPAVLAQ